MKLQDVIDEMQKEIETIQTLIEFTKSSNSIRYGRVLKVESISKYMVKLKKLNVEDLKRVESFLPFNCMHCDEYFPDEISTQGHRCVLHRNDP